MKALLATLALVPLLAPSSPVLAEDPRFDRLDAGEIVIRLGEISQEERMVLEELKHIGGIPRVIATRCQRADGTYYGTAGTCRKGREVQTTPSFIPCRRADRKYYVVCRQTTPKPEAQTTPPFKPLRGWLEWKQIHYWPVLKTET